MADPDTDFRLDSFLPYLVHRVGSRFAEGFGENFGDAGVSLQEWRVLAVLRESGALPIGEIARRTSINASTMTRLIGQVERRGFVRRERPLANQRTVYVRLLEDGRRKAEELIPQVTEYERELSACFSDAEIRTLKSLLARLYHSMTEGEKNGEEDRLAG